MKFKSLFIGILAAMSLVLGSCISNSTSNQTQSEQINNAFIYTVDHATGEVSKPSKISVIIETDYTDLTMGCTISSLNLPDGTKLPAAKFTGLKLVENNTGWMIAEGTMLRPEVTGFGEAAIPLFTKARIAAINHLGVVNGQTVAGYERAIRLETEKYTIFISPVQTWSTGKTNVETLTGTPNKFTSEKPAYLITLNLEKQTASISVHGAVFAPAMEDLGLVIEFRDVPFIATANGEIRLSRTETFDPYHDNAPNAGFPISNLTSTWNLFKGIDIAFTCDAKGGSYRVAADMPYYVATEK